MRRRLFTGSIDRADLIARYLAPEAIAGNFFFPISSRVVERGDRDVPVPFDAHQRFAIFCELGDDAIGHELLGVPRHEHVAGERDVVLFAPKQPFLSLQVRR